MENLGGMQRVATKLYEHLRAHPGVDLSTELLRTSWDWVHVQVVPFLARTGWRLYQAARRESVDVVLFSSMVTGALAVPLQSVFRQHGVTTAAIVHGLDVTTPFPPYQWFVPRVFGALDAVLPVSRATGAACTERGLPDHKLHIVPNGIDLDRFPPLDDRATVRRALKEALDDPAHPLPDDALLLCSVGRQVKRKGFAWFIEHVMPRLPDNVHYWLAGDGPRAEAIDAAIERHRLHPRVRRLGRVSEDDLRRLYRGSDLFVMPNVPVPGDMEGFGIVMLEANQCGCPVVAARLEGIQDVIAEGRNGHLVSSQDAAAFTGAIMAYQRDPRQLAEAAERARRYASDTFGWPSVTNRYVEVLRELHGSTV